MSSCVNCGKVAKFRCAACFAHQATVSYYCSKDCSKVHWPKHKTHCKLAQLYAAVRQMSTQPDAATVNNTAAHIGGIINLQVAVMIMYLQQVPQDKRPLLFGPTVPEASADYQATVERIKNTWTREQYKASYETRVPKELRDKSADRSTAHEVPLDCRPYQESMVGGRLLGGLEVYPSDHVQFDFYTFMRTYGKGYRSRLDPWRHNTADATPIPDDAIRYDKVKDFEW